MWFMCTCSFTWALCICWSVSFVRVRCVLRSNQLVLLFNRNCYCLHLCRSALSFRSCSALNFVLCFCIQFVLHESCPLFCPSAPIRFAPFQIRLSAPVRYAFLLLLDLIILYRGLLRGVHDWKSICYGKISVIHPFFIFLCGIHLFRLLCMNNDSSQKIPVMIDLDWLWLKLIEVVFQSRAITSWLKSIRSISITFNHISFTFNKAPIPSVKEVL